MDITKKYTFITYFLLLLALPLSVATAQSIVYVNSAANRANNGTSWSNAYTNLHTAITNAGSGDEIWVAEGTYQPTGNGLGREAHFKLKNGVAIYGGFDGSESHRNQRNWNANQTHLDGGTSQGGSNNHYHVIKSAQGENLNDTAILDGFYIRFGFANESGFANGGGISIEGGNSPLFRNVVVSNHDAAEGGGIAVRSTGSLATSPRFENTFVQNNRSRNGGGILVDGSNASPVFINTSVTGNEAGAFSLLGLTGNSRSGGIYIRNNASAVFINTVVANNLTGISGLTGLTSTARGGGIYASSNATATFINATIANNSVNVGGLAGGTAEGGGIMTLSSGSVVHFTNSIFFGNSVNATGLLSNQRGPQARLENGSTINFNSGITQTGSNQNSLAGGSAFNATNSTAANPQFVNPGSSNYRLQASSPAMDWGWLFGLFP